MAKNKLTQREIQVEGLRCILEEDPDRPEAAFSTLTICAVRRVNTPAQVLSAFHSAKDSYGAVHTEWSDPDESDEEVQGSAS